jgi:DNA-directed RNA polymerase specialized sigma24 family protein
MEKKLSFEECFDVIDTEIKKRRSKWTLTAISWMDFDDVSQIIKMHIHKKWKQYDSSKPLCPWLNVIITNQIKNLRRNVYDNNSRPCLKCAAAESDNLCSIYGKQCSSCPLYAKWEKTKKHAHDIRLPVSIENHSQEVFDLPTSYEIDLEKAAKNLHVAMKKILKPFELKVYELLYIKCLSEEETAKKMGWITSEKGRKPGYGRVMQVRKIIMEKVRLTIKDIDLF